MTAAGAAGVLRLASAAALPPAAGTGRRLGLVEALVVLAVLDGVFGAFAIAQVIGVSGAGAQTLRQAGMTYADYARSGFFQLLWAAGITLTTLVIVARVTDRKPGSDHVFKAAALGAVVLTLAVVYVAFRRLGLYEQAYGFTMLRLYSHVAALWIAITFLLLGADLAGVWAGKQRLAGLSGLAAVGCLLALNLANPEATVARLDLGRTSSPQPVDVNYLSSLSADATPELIDAGGPLRARACLGPSSYDPPWAAWVLAEAQAAARRSSCELETAN